MSYRVEEEIRDDVTLYALIDEAAQARAEIVSQFGANCFVYEVAGRPVLEPIAWEDFVKKPTSYGIPLLFPFPNRIRDSKFTFAGEEFKLDVVQHGFVRGRAWQLKETGADEARGAWLTATFDAKDYADEILAQYPFPFTAEVTYRLYDGTLHLAFTATNTGTRAMPCGFGIHPYFHWAEKSRLQIPARRRWLLEGNLPTGKIVAVTAADDLQILRDTSNLKLDDLYTDITADTDGLARAYLTDDATGTATVVEFDPEKLPHVVAYTTPAPRRALCIEPQSCPTDAFNLQARGIAGNVIELQPDERVEFGYRIYSQSSGKQ